METAAPTSGRFTQLRILFAWLVLSLCIPISSIPLMFTMLHNFQCSVQIDCSIVTFLLGMTTATSAMLVWWQVSFSTFNLQYFWGFDNCLIRFHLLPGFYLLWVYRRFQWEEYFSFLLCKLGHKVHHEGVKKGRKGGRMGKKGGLL